MKKSLRLLILALVLLASNTANAELPRPIRLALETSKYPAAGEAADVRVSVITEMPFEKVEVTLDDDGLGTLKSGPNAWTGALESGTTAVITAQVVFRGPGRYGLRAVAKAAGKDGIGGSDVAYLVFDVGVRAGKSALETDGDTRFVMATDDSTDIVKSQDTSLVGEMIDQDADSALVPPSCEIDDQLEASAAGADKGLLRITGRMMFVGRDGNLRPLRMSLVQLVNGSGSHLAFTYTNGAGYYTFGDVTNPLNRGVVVRVRTYYKSSDQEILVTPAGQSGWNGTYAAATPVYYMGDGLQNLGTLYVSRPTATNYRPKAFWAQMDMFDAYCKSSYQTGSCRVKWPVAESGAHYHIGGDIHLTLSDLDDTPDVMIHEMGHNVMYNLYNRWYPDAGCPLLHGFGGATDVGCAWSEGWASFYALAMSGDSIFNWPGGAGQDLENTDPSWTTGDRVEGRVAAALWDVMDGGANEVYDRASLSFASIWSAMRGNRQPDLKSFWNSTNWNKCTYLPCLYQNSIDYNWRPFAFTLPSLRVSLPTNGARDNAVDLWAATVDPECPDSRLRFSVTSVVNPVTSVAITNLRATIDANRYVDLQALNSWTGSARVMIRIYDGAEATSTWFTVAVGASALAKDEVETKVTPETVMLDDCFPNPFNPTTTISFALPNSMHARLEVIDIRGRVVQTLVDGNLDPGRHDYIWRGSDSAGRRVSSGVYFYRLDAGGNILTRRMMLLK